ncbi:hypothetical protein HDU92_000431 [Lobulomyces angularis]|nr:hypothetical protein HDU92_000431 [Lobulomyces angularis]
MSTKLASGRANKQQMFGPYYLYRTIGEGEFGKVKLAKHKDFMDKEVCVKLIKKENINNAVKRTKLMREISILQSLDHPFIVKLLEVIETAQYIGMVMELASGGELFEHILAHKYLKEKEACRFFVQLIAGVHYLHAHKYVHRDLKLENLLLDGNRNIIITDFGFANKSDGKDSLLNTSCGSPCYAAPELVISDGYVGEAADIWSCGVILFAMLCGYLPYDDDPANPDGDNINLLYKYILETELVMPDYLSEDAKHLLKRMLVPDPKYRAKMFEIFRHQWLKPYREILEESMNYTEQSVRELENSGNGKPAEAQTVPSIEEKSENIAEMEIDRKENSLKLSKPSVASEVEASKSKVAPTSSDEKIIEIETVKEVSESSLKAEDKMEIEYTSTPKAEDVNIKENDVVQNNIQMTGMDSTINSTEVVEMTTPQVVGNSPSSEQKEAPKVEAEASKKMVEDAKPAVLNELPSPIVKKSSKSSQMSIELEIPAGNDLMNEIMLEVNNNYQNEEENSSTTIKPVINYKVSSSVLRKVPSVALHNKNSRNVLLNSVSKSSIKDLLIEKSPKISTEENSPEPKQKAVTEKNQPFGNKIELPEIPSFTKNGKSVASVKFPENQVEPEVTEPTKYRKSMDVYRTGTHERKGEKSKFTKAVKANEDPLTEEFPVASVEVRASSTRTVNIKSKKSKNQTKAKDNTEEYPRNSISTYTTATSVTKPYKLRYHSGPIDQRALTNRPPIQLLDDIINLVTEMGMYVRQSTSDSTSFKLKVVRPQQVLDVVDIKKHDTINSVNNLQEETLKSEDSIKDNNSKSTSDLRSLNRNKKSHQSYSSSMTEKPNTARIISSFPMSLIRKVKYMAKYGQSWNKGFDGKEEDDAHLKSRSGSINSLEGNGDFKDATLSESGEIKFYIELQKIKNLKGLYVVEFKRRHGDIWEFKRLYHELIVKLPLGEDGTVL